MTIYLWSPIHTFQDLYVHYNNKNSNIQLCSGIHIDAQIIYI